LSTELTLYVRHGCHLCDAFREELTQWQSRWQFTVREVDIDSTSTLFDQYDTRVPVLASDSEEICQYFFDPDQLSAYFERN
jgi:hypothetical protein